METADVKLTDLASCGGCAAKYSAARLEELLRGFVPVDSEDLLVGLAPADDAAVYRLDDDRAIIFTLDFFPPVVDDPYDYGAIAATNALNDVFAMGGTPLLALSIAAFPESLPSEMLAAIFAAADERVRAAGGILAGGHTIRDEEPKYGLAVVGTVRPDAIWPKSGARPGDTLFLTKPLGTGLIMTGYKRGVAGTQPLERAVRWMRTLNMDAASVLRRVEPNAVTDVTGFGLFGHAHEVAERSGVRLRLESARFPAIDGALDLARSGILTSGDPRNREFAGPHLELNAASDALVALGYDPQTAGGLLVSVAAERSAVLEAEFDARRLFLRRVGRVEEGAGVVVE
ncbi:MAG TPA: selenide, water dikinase SelD [Gaiellaceae bacterium]